MKFTDKLKDLKNRLQDRHMYSIVLAVLALVAALTLFEYKRASDFRQLTENQYNRAFYDMKGYVDNVEMLLVKSMISTSTQRTASTMQDAWREATLAQENLGQLPVDQPDLEKASKFLIQVGDYANTINKKALYGDSITAKQYDTIKKLHTYSVSLKNNLDKLQSELESGRFKWGFLQANAGEVIDQTKVDKSLAGLKNLDTTFQNYPTLLYDGPFSDHIVDIKPKALDDKTLTQQEAQKKVEEFIGKDRLQSVSFTGKDDSSNVKTYSFEVKYKGSDASDVANMDITQKGGKLYWLLNNRNSGATKISKKQAIQGAKSYLEKRGYANLKESYYTSEGNTLVINFAGTQGDIILLPDLIKVKVALDNGEILGVEAKGYLYNHHTRDDTSVTYSLDEAKARVAKKAKVLSTKLAIIPTDFGTELLCHEIFCEYDKQEFIIYINAKNGREENILMLLKSDNGTLAM